MTQNMTQGITPELIESMARIRQLLTDLKHMPEVYANEIKKIETISSRYKSGLALLKGDCNEADD